jgi:uncharacterized membrane protein (UPF0127 family)
MKLHLAWLARALAALMCCGSLAGAQAQGNGQPQQLPMVTVQAGLYNIKAMVAQTDEQRAIGLMYREELGNFEGMLFAFERPGIQCFWMKNTLIPLDAAFVADDGRIVNIAAMRPQSLESHCSEKPVRYVLEMNLGWFSKRGLGPGSRLSGPPFGP